MKKNIILILLIMLIISIVFNIYFYFNKKNYEVPNIKYSDSINIYLGYSSKLLKTITQNTDEIKNIFDNAKLIESRFDCICDYSGPQYSIKITATVTVSLWIGEENVIISYSNEECKWYVIDKNDLEKLKEYLELETYSTDCSIIKTFDVLNVAYNNEPDFVFITIREYDYPEIITIKLEKRLANFKVNKSYEFNFQLKHKIGLYSIKEYFDYTDLISVKETNKKGMDQLQHEPCVY